MSFELLGYAKIEENNIEVKTKCDSGGILTDGGVAAIK